MGKLRAVFWRLRGLFSRDRLDRDMTEEIESHVQLHIDDQVRAGLTPEEARRRAILALGGMEQTKERYRDHRAMLRLDAAVQDIRYALRLFRKHRALLVATTLSIGLGVGINIAIYSVVHVVLFGDWMSGASAPDRMVTIWPGLSYPNFTDLQGRATLVQTAATQASTLVWQTPGGSATLSARIVSANFFDITGARFVLGRTFGTRVDDVEDRVVVSEAFWRERLGANPAVIGQTIRLNGWPFIITGVLDRGFALPVGPLVTPSVYAPISTRVSNGLPNRAAAQFDLIGRLADGATRQQGLASIQSAFQELESAFPAENDGLARAVLLFDGTPSSIRLALSTDPRGRLLLMLVAAVYGLVALVLVIACTNVAGLLIARADQRRHEIALRLALGASRGRLVQQSLAESLVIAVLGCTFGMAIWSLTTSLVPRMRALVNAGIEVVPVGLPLAYCLLLVIAVTIACGLAPAWSTTGVAPLIDLKAGRFGRGRGPLQLQNALVGAQVAVSVVLLTAAFVLLHAVIRLNSVDPGYDVLHTVMVDVRLPTTRPGPPDASMAASKRDVESIPGIESVAYGSLPLALLPRTAMVSKDGAPDSGRWAVDLHPVGPGYLQTMRIPLQRGRDLSDDDLRTAGGSATAIVVNETLARQYLRSEPIGELIRLDRNTESGRTAQTLRVVGVARDVKTKSLADEGLPVIYIPAAGTSMIVRVAGPVAAAPPELYETVAAQAPGATVIITPMSDRVAAAILPVRIATLLIGTLAGLGLLLAAVGLHGIVNSVTTRRSFEIGVRVALGATRLGIVWLVARGVVALIAAGSVTGGLLALVVVQALKPLLAAQQSPLDPIAGLAVMAVLLLVGALASAVPARRAASIDPAITLRSE